MTIYKVKLFIKERKKMKREFKKIKRDNKQHIGISKVDLEEQLRASIAVAEQTEMTRPGESAALSSYVSTRYDLIPRLFLERVAARFELGTKKYPPFNYSHGLSDKAYIIDRLNHLQEHVQALLWPKNEEELLDDNEAAIGWATAFLTLCDKKMLKAIREERYNVQRTAILSSQEEE